MRAYIIRRLLLVIPTLFLASLIVFFVVRLIPGDIIDLMLTENAPDAAMDRGAIERALGLDVPIHIQYVRWMADIITHGNLGKSLWMKTSVTEEVLGRLPVSFELGLLGAAIALLISFPIGIYSAVRQDTAGDYLGRSFAIACIAVPGFWLGTMVMVFPAIWWGWSPPIMFTPFLENPIENLRTMIIPAAILGMLLSGANMRMIRTMMLEVMRQDYIRTAWAKGLGEMTVLTRHALRNALIPVVTLIGLQMPILVSGVVVIEQIFCLPGLALLLLEATTQRDYPIITGTMLVFSIGVLIINLAVDLSYGFFDPRVQYK